MIKGYVTCAGRCGHEHPLDKPHCLYFECEQCSRGYEASDIKKKVPPYRIIAECTVCKGVNIFLVECGRYLAGRINPLEVIE